MKEKNKYILKSLPVENNNNYKLKGFAHKTDRVFQGLAIQDLLTGGVSSKLAKKQRKV